MTLALVRRHRLAIETALYGSIGSLRRLRGKKRSNSGAKPSNSGEEASNSNNNNITTATEVAFFPRYSVVNKSWREEKSNKKKPDQKEKVKSSNETMKKDAGTQEKEKEVSKSHLDKSVRGDKNNANS